MTNDRRLTTSENAARLKPSGILVAEAHQSLVVSRSYPEDQLVPLSAVSHYVHCPRRCALIHLEQAWSENIFTAEGRVLHEKVDSGKKESRGDLKILRSVRLRSLRLGITGIADVVELHRCAPSEGGISLPGVNGTWRPFPVEYKRGAARDIQCYKVQLCAQAICLEEMLNTRIPEGALFLGERQQRSSVAFTDALRSETEEVCHDVQRLFSSGVTPPAEYSKRCSSCSLLEACLPKSAGSGKSARAWLTRELDALDRMVPEK
jgi:CRISPR-associated exonuclease Cas4